jgi:hypothetical protein
MSEEEIERTSSPFELPGIKIPTPWIMAVADLLNHGANLCHAMGLPNSTAQLETMAKVVMETIELEVEQTGQDPLLILMQRLLDTGNERKDTRTLMEVSPIRSVMSDRIWRTTMLLHSQILKANQYGWTFYENIHLMLEQREAWSQGDVLWLIAVAVDYIEGRV